jgi:membrane dipeptidase
LDNNQFVGIIDGHQDVLYALENENRDFFVRSDKGQVDLPRLLDGGVRAALFAMYLDADCLSYAADRCLEMRDELRKLLERGSDEMRLVTTVDDLLRANSEGKFAVILHLEGAESIGEDMEMLHTLYDMGLRTLGITWSRSNIFAEGVGNDNRDHGLSEAGIKLVQECNRIGVVLDVSHINEEGFWDVIKYSKKPVVATHSNAKALGPSQRNLSDEQIQAIAKGGGTIGINFYAGFLRADMSEDSEGEKPGANTPPSLIIDHIDHIVKLVGIDHVAFGSDYDGSIIPPAGLDDVSKFPIVIQALRDHGYSEEDIRKISSGNLIRVFQQTWK